MIKYRLAFTIPAETLFGLMAKVLPIEDLNVEEIVDRAPPAKIKHISPPQLERKKKLGRPKRVINIEVGANAIIMELFSDDKRHRAIELKSLFAARGLSRNGVGSALEKLKKRGLIFQPEHGFWQRVATDERKSA